MDSHRGDWLKRKAWHDPVAEEDRQTKRRMLELAEESARIYAESTAQINTNIANICTTIQDGFALLREMMNRPLLFVQPHNGGQPHGNPSPHPASSTHPATSDLVESLCLQSPAVKSESSPLIIQVKSEPSP